MQKNRFYEIPVFTTRPDTLFGVTFLALAPEHPLLATIATAEQSAAVADYVAKATRLAEIDRLATDKEKTGVFTGAYAIHPLNGARIPIWVAGYVLPGYGTGAVMGVPAHDERDYDFARKVGLPVVEVVSPDGQSHGAASCFTGYGLLIDAGAYSGMSSAAASARIIADLEAKGLGQKQITYKMRDWLISRQRYWGAPIPIVHCPECGAVPVPGADLPLRLPDTADFAPTGDGRSPLARIDAWVNTTCPRCGGPAQRETDTMDGFACSSWYFLRFANPRYSDGPFDPAAVRAWLPVDTYVGGAEHAVMHLLYARFWTKVMADAGLVDFVEPFIQLRNQGMVLSAADGRKMSKSKGNVVTPDEVVAEHGADALRAYLLFLGPFDTEVIWDDRGIKGITRFLDKYWRLAQEVRSPPHLVALSPSQEFERRRHQTIKRITEDMAQFRFNTAVAALMAYLNYLIEAQDEPISAGQWRQAIETITLLLAPIAPFITEEVWQTVLGHEESVHCQPWPAYDEAQAAEVEITIVVQVNGKLRDRVTVVADAGEAAAREAAVNSPIIQHYLNGQTIRNVIVVPQKLVNIVV